MRFLVPIAVAAALWSSRQSTFAASDGPTEARVLEIERSFDLLGLMERHHVPGLSVALIDGFNLAWAKGYGVTEPGGSTSVTPRTLFLAGSISKPVTAVVALRLVQKGELSLDQDVNLRLKTWRIPNHRYGAGHPVTLVLLLDHAGGFTGGDFFPGYSLDQTPPSLVQILDGVGGANTPPARVGFAPGSRWQYSGHGYLVVQQLMIDATGHAFPVLMREELFERVGMKDSTFEQPLPATRAASAAAGTRADGSPVPGRWHVQPEMAAGGLWTTPSDLAQLALELALSLRGKANHVLSPEMTRTMLAPHIREGVRNILGSTQQPDAMGYGFFVGEGHRFGHIGGNVGYQSTLIMFGDEGHGAVVMTNSDVGLQVGNVLLEKISKAYGWGWVPPPPP